MSISKGKITIHKIERSLKAERFLTNNQAQPQQTRGSIQQILRMYSKVIKKDPNTNEDLRAFAWNVSPTGLSYSPTGTMVSVIFQSFLVQ